MKDVAMFRELTIPEEVAGRLFLDGMPGRREPLERAWEQLKAQDISVIICLAGTAEIRRKSPDYLRAIASGTVPRPVIPFAIPDFGVPKDRDAFWGLASEVAKRLVAGESILIHCGAGRGRTGSLAECVLLALGQTADAARAAASEAGSGAETPRQRRLVSWYAARSAAATGPNNRIQEDATPPAR